MIERLILKDFQCHESLDLKLAPVTTITGASDAGKSAIIRAAILLALNKPAGKQFIRHGTKQAAVRAVVDGRKVQRIRGASKNSYHLDGRRFVSFAGALPQNVDNLLRMNHLNFQRQLDAHFWFSLTPGQIAKALNGIINLEEIDEITSRAKLYVGRQKAENQSIREQGKECVRKLKSLAWAKQFDTDLTKLEVEESRLAAFRQKTGRIREMLEDYANIKVFTRPVPRIDKLQALRSEADEIAESNRGLALMIRKVKEAKEACRLRKQALDEVQKQWQTLTKNRCPVCGKPNPTGKSLASCSPTFTCDPPPRRPVRSPIGTKSKKATCSK